MSTPTARILLIDNYDSFTYNLVQAFRVIGAEVIVHRNDAIEVEEARSLDPTHLVVSPGPGTPERTDVSMAMIEAMLGRLRGHSVGDDSLGVVPEKDLERYRAEDPVPAYAERLADEQVDLLAARRVVVADPHQGNLALGLGPRPDEGRYDRETDEDGEDAGEDVLHRSPWCVRRERARRASPHLLGRPQFGRAGILGGRAHRVKRQRPAQVWPRILRTPSPLRSDGTRTIPDHRRAPLDPGPGPWPGAKVLPASKSRGEY